MLHIISEWSVLKLFVFTPFIWSISGLLWWSHTLIEGKSWIKRITEEMMASIVQIGSRYPTLNRIASVEKVCYIKHERVFVQFGLHSISNGPCFLSNDGGVFGKVYFVLCYFLFAISMSDFSSSPLYPLFVKPTVNAMKHHMVASKNICSHKYKHWTPNIGHWTSNIEHRTPNTEHQAHT